MSTFMQYHFPENPDGLWDTCAAINSQIYKRSPAPGQITIHYLTEEDGHVSIILNDPAQDIQAHGDNIQEVLTNYGNQLNRL